MTTPLMNRRGRVWRRFVGGLSAVALALQVGCYSYLPLQTSVPAAGQRIAIVLNDRGRSNVADRLGSALDKVDGLLVSSDASSVTLDVYRTFDLRGNAATWTGERVQVSREGVTGYQTRQFSKKRTTLLTVAVVGAIAASMLLVNFDLFSGFTRDKPGDGGSTGESR